MSSRTKIVIAIALFAPTALLLLTEPEPLTAELSHSQLTFSILADGLALLICLAACLMAVRLAHQLRDRISYASTIRILALFLGCFGLQRMGSYARWEHLRQIAPELQMVRAAALVAVALAAAVLFPYVRSMLRSLLAANQEQERFAVAAESSLDAFYLLESVHAEAGDDSSEPIIDFCFCYVNRIGEQRLHRPRTELIGKRMSELLPYMSSSGLLERCKEVVRTDVPFTDEHPVQIDGHEPYWIAMQVVKLGDGIVIRNRDVTDERAQQHQIANLSEFTQSIIENAPFSIIATDPAGTVIAMNPAAESLTLYEKQELIGQHSLAVLHDPGEMSARAVQLSKDLNRPTSAGFDTLIARPNEGETDEREWTYVRKDGSRIWVNLAMTALKAESEKITGYLGIAFDITERKKLTDYVHHMAHHDQLTGLPNRLLLDDRVREAVQRAKRDRHKVAVFMVDIDHFKRINDSLGHSAGDSLLKMVGKKLCSTVRQTDTVARMGGDEFVIVMPEFRDEKDALRCAESIIQKVATPTVLGNHEVNVTVSVGLCIFPDWARDGDSLLKNADAAMYVAKESGRNGFHVFNEGMIEATVDKIEFERDLRHAMANGELSLHYQPQVSCMTGEVIGMEALLRWNHPQRGAIAPLQFVPLAEATGMIVPMGEWAIRRACQEGKRIQQSLGREVVIAVNLSPRQFRQKNLASLVERALDESGLAAACLEIEITEQTLMTNSVETHQGLMQLRRLGVKIAIDDFGTGFSNFSYLLQYEVDRLKIDQSFVNRSAGDPTAAAIVRAIISMAHGLNLKVVAEGVETSDQLTFLLRRRCDQAQGFYFSRPVPLEQVGATARLIAEHRAAEPAWTAA